MNVLQEILTWSHDQKPWQQDALRRLVQKNRLDETDIKELFALLLAEQDLQSGDVPIPDLLSQDHLPNATNASDFKLLKIRGLKNVNKVSDSQEIKVCHQGITIIYGDNGTGKSGYARVLKRACKARDQNEAVLPDVFLPPDERGIPEARFKIEVDGHAKMIKWVEGVTPPVELSSISVFDTSCARLYITGEEEAAFLPYGVDILKRLAEEVYPELTLLVDEEMKKNTVSSDHFSDLEGETKVGTEIDKLGADSSPEKIEQLASLHPEEIERLRTVRETLRESNPADKIAEVQLKRTRLEDLKKEVEKIALGWSNEKVSDLRKFCADVDKAQGASDHAAELLRGESHDPLLSGTGGNAWKAMYEAARKFSEDAYPFEDFPNTNQENDARCLLCQQELKEGAERMRRFDEFILKDLSEHSTKLNREHFLRNEELKRTEVDFRINESMRQELADLDPSLPSQLDQIQKTLRERREKILAALETNNLENIPAEQENLTKCLESPIVAVQTQITTLRQAIESDERRLLELEADELDARARLSKRKTCVLESIQKAKTLQKLQKCKKALNPNGISRKNKAITKIAVTQELGEALNQELRAVGLEHLDFEYKSRGSNGTTLLKLSLDLPEKCNLDKFLSEGEQRAIALGAFLAELTLSNNTHPIILDDPVSSMDHSRRKKIASRLVDEAKKRQVIIFTHDSTFLGILRDCVEKDSESEAVYFLEWQNGRPGRVVEGLPWGHKTFNERLNWLRMKCQKLGREWNPVPSDAQKHEMANAYGSYRAAIERLVQERVFRGVIRRYSDWVNVSENTLRKVTKFSDSECDEILRLYQIGNDNTGSHDSASDANFGSRTPSDFERDIDDLESLWKALN